MANSDVPSVTIMTGNSYGAGNYGMNGRSFNPRFLFSYPQSKLAVMGSDQIAGVMEIIKKTSAKSLDKKYDSKKQKIERINLIKSIEESSSATFSSDKIWDDGILDPIETRNYLAFVLTVIYNSQIKGSKKYGVWRH